MTQLPQHRHWPQAPDISCHRLAGHGPRTSSRRRQHPSMSQGTQQVGHLGIRLCDSGSPGALLDSQGLHPAV